MDSLWTGLNSGGTGYQTMLGGIGSVAKYLHEASASIIDYTYSETQSDREVSRYWNTSGQSASNYITSDVSTYGDCTMTFEDATTDIVNTIRELMFRSAIAQSIADKSSVPPPPDPGRE